MSKSTAGGGSGRSPGRVGGATPGGFERDVLASLRISRGILRNIVNERGWTNADVRQAIEDALGLSDLDKHGAQRRLAEIRQQLASGEITRSEIRDLIRDQLQRARNARVRREAAARFLAKLKP